jgi:hypothetical protein
MWINAQNTSDRRYTGITNNGKNLSSPNDGDDWLLLLTEKNLDNSDSLQRQ